MSFILIFIDGLGLGKKDVEINPCASNGIRYLAHFANTDCMSPIVKDGYCVPTDATLEINGLPQSATGQTTLLTGINCGQVLGRHLQGYPNEKLRNLLRHHSILKQMKDLGYRCAFINTYRPLFFQLKEKTRWFLSTTTVATLSAELPFFSIEDLLAKRSIYHDFTNKSLVAQGFKVPRYSSKEAGHILTKIAQDYHFILYEYFLTDHAGHDQNQGRAVFEIKKLDQFLDTILNTIDLEKNLILLTSDHGNIEDLSVKTHTVNRVPSLIWGKDGKVIAEKIHALQDITPAIINFFKENVTNPKSLDDTTS